MLGLRDRTSIHPSTPSLDRFHQRRAGPSGPNVPSVQPCCWTSARLVLPDARHRLFASRALALFETILHEREAPPLDEEVATAMTARVLHVPGRDVADIHVAQARLSTDLARPFEDVQRRDGLIDELVGREVAADVPGRVWAKLLYEKRRERPQLFLRVVERGDDQRGYLQPDAQPSDVPKGVQDRLQTSG